MSTLRAFMVTGTAYSLVALVVAKAITVMNSVVVSRLLGSGNLGILSIQNSVLALAAIFATSGIPSAAVKFIAEKGTSDSKSVGEIVSSGLVMTAIAASAAAATIIALAPYIASSIFAEGRLVTILVIGAIGLFLTSVPAPAFALLQGLKRLRDMNLQNVLVAAVSVPVTIGLVYLYGLVGAAAALVGTALTTLIINLRFLRRIQIELGLHWHSPRFALSWRMLKYGIGTVLAGLVATPAILFSYTLLASTHSFEVMGHYAVAFALASYLAFIPNSVGVPLVPTVSELSVTSPESVSSLLVKTIRLVSWAALPLSLVMILLSRPIVSILYGTEFLPSADLLRLTAAAAYFITVTSVVGFTIAGTGKVWHGIGLNGLWGALYFAMSWVLVPSYGSLGLAASLLTSYVVHSATVLVYSRWAFGLDLSKLFAPIVVASSVLSVSIGLTMSPIESIRWLVVPLLLGLVLVVEWTCLWPSERNLVRDVLRKTGRLLTMGRAR